MTKMMIERRTLPTEFEVRTQGTETEFYGYALKWGARSQNLGGFREEVDHGATTKTIQEADIRALINHDPNLILGRNRAGTLDLSEDATGLHYRVRMPGTTYARDLAVSMERGDVTQSSFGFRTINEDWSIDTDEFPLRTLKEIALFDVSPVTYPAYIDSTSGARSALEGFAETRGLNVESLSDLDVFRAAIRGDVEPEPNTEATTRIPRIYSLPINPRAALLQLHNSR